GAPDGERVGQAAEAAAAGGEGSAAGDHERSDPRGRRGRDRPLRGRLRREVSEGGHVPTQGPGRASHVPRLPGRTLEAYPHIEPDRVDVRDGPSAATDHKGTRLEEARPHDGLQADPDGPG